MIAYKDELHTLCTTHKFLILFRSVLIWRLKPLIVKIRKVLAPKINRLE